jgi:transcriptional regulator with XRE-family HTH domain
MTQAEVAKSVGVHQSSVSFWETGETKPRASLLVKLAALYGVTVDELLRED